MQAGEATGICRLQYKDRGMIDDHITWNSGITMHYWQELHVSESGEVIYLAMFTSSRPYLRKESISDGCAFYVLLVNPEGCGKGSTRNEVGNLLSIPGTHLFFSANEAGDGAGGRNLGKKTRRKQYISSINEKGKGRIKRMGIVTILWSSS